MHTPLRIPATPSGIRAISPTLVLVLALLLTYGYGVFTFALTIDEESQIGSDSLDRARLALIEGRWAMSAFALLLPSPVVPVVSTGLGVALSGWAWWHLCRHKLDLTPWRACMAAALAGTVPVLAFMFSFSTVAMPIGMGNVLVVGFTLGLTSKTWRGRALGIAAGAAAIGVYDAFFIALLATGLAFVVARPTKMVAAYGLFGAVASFLISRLLGQIFGWLFNVPSSSYASSFFDVTGLLNHPRTRLLEGWGEIARVVSLDSGTFGLSSPLLAVSCVALLALTIVGLFLSPKDQPRVLSLRVIAILGVLALPVMTSVLSPSLPLRSMVYLPYILISLCVGASLCLDKLRAIPMRVAAIALAVVLSGTVVAHATITNRLFSSAATTYALDQQLAYSIGKEKGRLIPGSANLESPMIISGLHSWPSTPLTRATESLGRSFFDWDEYRGIQFLRSQGVLVHYATEDDSARLTEQIEKMPSYPADGWVALAGDVLLVKLK